MSRRRHNRRGYFKFKAQCPECKRMVKGYLPWDEHEGKFQCECGEVLKVMVFKQFEWVKGGDVDAQSNAS